MIKQIREIHASFGDYSIRYRIGDAFDPPGIHNWGKITNIEYDQFDSLQHNLLVYNIFANNHLGVDAKEELCKKIIGLPVEITYKVEF